MCRNIRVLYNFEPPASSEEVNSAALQYVRKVSGMTKSAVRPQIRQKLFQHRPFIEAPAAGEHAR